ncbi:hypothetical protein Emed_006096 [Eimeria media]
MALHAVFEICLQFCSFRNVDLLHQGSYRVQAQLYVHPDVEILYATQAEAERPPAAAAAAAATGGQQQQQQQDAFPGVAPNAAPKTAAAASAAAAGEERRSGYAGGGGGVVCFSEPPSYVLHDCAAEWLNAAVAAVPSMHFAAATGASTDTRSNRGSGGPQAAHKNPFLAGGGPLPLGPGEGAIDQETNAFRTKPFFIRFSDETIPVSQVVTYRLELPFSSVVALDAAACVLQLLLLYSTGNATTAKAAAAAAAAKAATAAGTTPAETASSAGSRNNNNNDSSSSSSKLLSDALPSDTLQQQQQEQQQQGRFSGAPAEPGVSVGVKGKEASADPKQQQQQQQQQQQAQQQQQQQEDQQQRKSLTEPVVLAGRWLLVRNLLKGEKRPACLLLCAAPTSAAAAAAEGRAAAREETDPGAVRSGVHAYAPVLFDCNASCLLESPQLLSCCGCLLGVYAQVLIFASLLDIRVRLRPSLPAADLSVSPVSSVSAASSLSSSASALLYSQRTAAERHYAAAIRATRAAAAAADRQQQQQQEQQDDDEAYWRSFKAHEEGDAQQQHEQQQQQQQEQQQQQRQLRNQRVRLLRKARGEDGAPQAGGGGGAPGTAGAPAWGPPGDWEVSSSLESFLLAAGRRLCEEDPTAAAAAAAALEDCSRVQQQQQQQQRQKQDKAAAELIACAAAVHASCMRCLLESYVRLVLRSSVALSVCLSPSSQLLLSPLLQQEDLALPGGDVLSLSELLDSPSKVPAAAAAAARRAAAAAAAQGCLLLNVPIPPTSTVAGNGGDHDGSSESNSSSSSNSISSNSSDSGSRHITVRLPRLSLRVPFPCSAEQLCNVLSSVGLLALLRMEWETFLCQGLSPFILHRTVPAFPLSAAGVSAAAASLQRQQQQQQQRKQKQQTIRPSAELQWVMEEGAPGQDWSEPNGCSASSGEGLTPSNSRTSTTAVTPTAAATATTSAAAAGATTTPAAAAAVLAAPATAATTRLSLLCVYLRLSLSTTFVADRPVLFEETYCTCYGAACGPSSGWCGSRWCSGAPLGAPHMGGLGGWEGGPPLATRGYLPIRMHSPIVSPLSMQPQRRGAHLFVLVHGFQGTPSDFRIFKAALCASYQHAACLSSTANADDTEGDIEVMGERLASEVLAYVQECFGTRGLDRISFIGHSLGGIIVRAALRHLRASLGSRFHSYLSLSSPHFGYLKGRSRLVSLGLWFLKKWRKSLCLQQLTLSDSRDARQCLLYRLSRCDCLGLFKYVCLVASTQDTYAPLHSAVMLPMHQQETAAAAAEAGEAENLSVRNVSPRRDDSSSSYSLSSRSCSKPSSERGDGQRLAASVPLSPGTKTPDATSGVSLLVPQQRGGSGEALSETDSSSAVFAEDGLQETERRQIPQKSFALDSSDDEDGTQQQTIKQSHLLARLSRNIAARVSPDKILRLNQQQATLRQQPPTAAAPAATIPTESSAAAATAAKATAATAAEATAAKTTAATAAAATAAEATAIECLFKNPSFKKFPKEKPSGREREGSTSRRPEGPAVSFLQHQLHTKPLLQKRDRQSG